MNQIYQATIKLLESDPDTKGFQSILEEGLSRLGRTPTDASGREIEKALKSNVYRQLQVSLPAAAAKNKIQSILAKVALLDAPSLSESSNAKAELDRQAALIAPLEAGQKRFTLYFEWSEVQKFRSQLKVIQEQQQAGNLIPDLLRDATRQLELLEAKLQDSLVRQGQDINELLVGLERVKSMGGPRVKRLESLVGQISEAQSSQSLAPAEVERARKLVVELRKLVESSVVAVTTSPVEAEEDSIIIEEPTLQPLASATGEILQIESADDEPELDISFDFTELEPEASARMHELDISEERRKLDTLERDFRAVLEASADASVALSELRVRNNNNELIQNDLASLKATLETRYAEELLRQRAQLSNLPQALDRFAASGLNINEARLTLSVAEGMLGSNVLAGDEISKLEDLVRTFERQFEERERARLEEQSRIERALTRQTATLNQMREVVSSFMPLGLAAVTGFNNKLAELERDTQARVLREDITKALSDEMHSLQQSLEAFEAQKRLEAEQKAEAERKALEAKLEAERKELEAKLEAERKALEEKIRLEREQAIRKAAEAAAKEAAERAEMERRAAEAIKRAEDERAEKERQALEAKLEAERLAVAKLEAERLEAERISQEKAAREAAERAELERREAQAKAEAEAREAAAKAEAERLEGIRKAQINRETGALRTLRFSLAALPDLEEISASINALETSFEAAAKQLESGVFITDELEAFKTSLSQIGQEASSVFETKLGNLEERAKHIKANELLEDIKEARIALEQGEHPDLNQLEASLRAQREARLNAQRRELSELESAVREYAAMPEASSLLTEITNARGTHESGQLLDLASAWDKLEDLRLNEESLLNQWRSKTDALVLEANGYKQMGGETIRQLSRLADALAAERNMSRITPETRTRLEKNLEEAQELILHARQEYAAASAVAAALADSSQIDDLLGVFSMKQPAPVEVPKPEPVVQVVVASLASQVPAVGHTNALHQWLADISRERGIGQTGIIRSDGTLETGNVARAAELGHLLAETERYNLDLSSELRRKPARLHTIEYQGGALIAMFMRKNEAEASSQSTIVIQLEDMASYSRIFAQAQRDYDQLLEWALAV